MKLTFRKKDYFYARLYETITDRLDDSSTDELFTMYKELDERFRFGFKAEEVEKLVSFWIGCSFEDFIEICENAYGGEIIKELKERMLPPKEKKYCQVCGKEIKGDGEKYCSYECAEKASRKYEVTKEQLIQDFK